jgi:hypothetical protein
MLVGSSKVSPTTALYETHSGGPMKEPTRIKPQEARKKVAAGTALLVCGYEEIEKCNSVRLQGAMTMQDFRARRPGKGQEIILYCA